MPVNVNEIEPDEKIVEIEMERLNKKLSIEGILITMVDYRTNYAKDITEMLRESYGDTDGVMESIRINGILSPVLVRPIGNDTYEMVSGHRRMQAAAV